VPGLFDGIDWSTPRVMAQTRVRLCAAGAAWQELPTLWDVDVPHDLARLATLDGWRARQNLNGASCAGAFAQ
jgi:glycosyltransferase A (GT-A) superfamily protein (DUF2064 family)